MLSSWLLLLLFPLERASTGLTKRIINRFQTQHSTAHNCVSDTKKHNTKGNYSEKMFIENPECLSKAKTDPHAGVGRLRGKRSNFNSSVAKGTLGFRT